MMMLAAEDIPPGSIVVLGTNEYEVTYVIQDADGRVRVGVKLGDAESEWTWGQNSIIRVKSTPVLGPTPTPAGRKDDAGKPSPSLLPIKPLMAIVDVLTFGARKYDRDNWMKVDNAVERYEDAMLRHLFAWKAGETNDPESGLPHLAHAGCCLLFLMHFELAPESTPRSDK